MMQGHSGATGTRLAEKLDYPNPDLVSGGGAGVAIGWSFGGVRVEILRCFCYGGNSYFAAQRSGS